MSKKNDTPDLDAYLEKGAANIFHAYVFISCLGFIIDIINFYQSNKIFYNNVTSVSITVIIYSLYRFKRLNLKTSFGIILYIALANVIIDSFSDLFSPNRVYFFLRDSLFMSFLLTLISLIIRKTHAIIITVIYVGSVIAMTLITKNIFLQESIYLIILFVTAYAIVVYYFVGVIEKSILEREKHTQIIKEKNDIVNETNTLLEESQQQIEEQSEKLTSQTEVLKDQADLLALKNKELEQLNKTKDLFLSVLAHDLKGPFHLMIGFSEILEKEFNKLDDAKKIHYINLLSDTSRKTFNLFENLLIWTTSQSNAIANKPIRIAMNGLIKANIILFKENYENKEIKIVENILQDCFIMADENMIHTVIRNLFSNAIKFTPLEGQIYISCIRGNNEILVEIKDTGIGMDEETLESLFKIDKPESITGTSGEVGTGLGLLICKDFIEKNGGKIWATSKINNGSTFTFSIPATD